MSQWDGFQISLFCKGKMANRHGVKIILPYESGRNVIPFVPGHTVTYNVNVKLPNIIPANRLLFLQYSFKTLKKCKYNQMESINYVIATYNGRYRQHEDKERVLQKQLEELYKILEERKESLIKQITIVCPTPRHPPYEHYYQKEKWLQAFSKINVQIEFLQYKGDNNDHSYDQWIQGYQKHPEYTHHLFVEDDYCVYNNKVFDYELLDLYKQKFPNNIGYLCSMASTNGHDFHAAISNGLISTDTFKSFSTDPLILYYSSKHGYPQLKFSYMFTDNGIPLDDFSDQYKILFWHSNEGRVIDYSKPGVNRTCIVPVQVLGVNTMV